MPFVALDKNTGKRIDITKIQNPRKELKSGDLICPLCEQDMYIRSPVDVRSHFVHKVLCTSDFERHPESPEHLMCKDLISNTLPDRFPGYEDAQIEKEYRLDEVKRQADIMVTFPNGWREIHEIQLSAITVESLEQRTRDYERAGCDVVWWLGHNADTEANRNWLLNYFGYCFRIEITIQRRDLRL